MSCKIHAQSSLRKKNHTREMDIDATRSKAFERSCFYKLYIIRLNQLL